MNRKILALNLALLVLLGTLGWLLRAHWREARARQLATLSKPPRQIAQLPPPSPVPPSPAVPANYLDVAQKTLFSKDRNPNVIIEAAPVPPPPPPQPPPPRPAYFGQMGFEPPVALLSGEKGAQKGFRVGDKVGPFKLVAFDQKTITFEWQGKTLEYPLEELRPKDLVPQAAAPAANVVSASPVIATTTDKNPTLGGLNGEIRSCVPGDQSPSGTVKDGFRKVVVPGPFGVSCLWEPIK